MKGRMQSVSINNVLQLYEFTGFPQGPVLGPFMYTVCTTSLFPTENSHGVLSHTYADDTQVYLCK